MYPSLFGGYGYYRLMETIAIAATYISISIFIIISLIPLFNEIVQMVKRIWLKSAIANTSLGKDENSQLKNELLGRLPQSNYPVYKMYKFYMLSIGILLTFGGFLITIIHTTDPDVIRFLTIIPLLLGGTVFLFWRVAFTDSRLWKEVATAFLYLGFGTSFFLMLAAYEVTFIRGDLLLYIVLGVGVALIYKYKAMITSYLTLLTVIVAVITLKFVPPQLLLMEMDWLQFSHHILWAVPLFIFYVWLPNYKDKTSLGSKEIILGFFFAICILSLAGFGTDRLYVLALAITIPALYLFSKKYFIQSGWFMERPIQIIILYLLSGVGVLMCTGMGIDFVGNQIYLFKFFSFYKLIAFFIIASIGMGGAYLYFNEMDEKERDAVNLPIVIFPLVAFFIIYIIGDWGGQFLMSIALGYIGYDYIQKGTQGKNSFLTLYGAGLLLNVIWVQLYYLPNEVFMEAGQVTAGILTMFIGATIIGMVMYLKSLWTVTDDTDLPSNLPPNENEKIIDNVIVE